MTDEPTREQDDDLGAEEIAEGVGDFFGAKGGEDEKTMQPDAPPSEDDA